MNLKLFTKRLISFYSSWSKHNKDLWGNSDVLVICTQPLDSPSSTNPFHSISSSFFFWLMGHHFHDTIAIFTRSNVYFLCTKKGLFILQTLVVPAMEAVNALVTTHPKSKDDNGLEFMDEVIREIRVTNKVVTRWDENRPLVIGYVFGESPKSKLFFWDCFENIKPKEFQSVHASGFSWLLLNHDQDARFEKKFRHRRDLELSERCDSRVYFGSHGKGEDVWIQSPLQTHKFEQMEAPWEADNKKLQLEKGKGNPPLIVHNHDEHCKKYEHPKDLERSSSNGYILVSSEEDDEWVLVEDDDKEQSIGRSIAAKNYWSHYKKTNYLRHHVYGMH